MASGDAWADLIVEDAVSLRPFLDEPLHVPRVDAEYTASDINVFAKVANIRTGQLVRDGLQIRLQVLSALTREMVSKYGSMAGAGVVKDKYECNRGDDVLPNHKI